MRSPGQIAATLPVTLDAANLKPVGAAFVALAGLDLQNKPGPALYESGVRYAREPAGRERWQLPSETRAIGRGDCEDLAVWRVAELRARGEKAKLLLRRSGDRLWHAMVRRGNGSIEDPSKRLGMRGNA
jgi:hypothetical protein